LLARIDAMIEEDPVSRVHLRVPQKEGKTLAMLEAKARIYSRAYRDGAVDLDVEAPESVVRRVTEFIFSESKSVELRGDPISATRARAAVRQRFDA
jgi:predicted GH43/DUF377 family glycosyl hydrolase